MEYVILARKNRIAGIAGALLSALMCAASASGATIKWTGGGDGTTWGNGDNWGGSTTGLDNVTLAADSSSNWKLRIRESERRIELAYLPKGLAVMVR